jgi:diguanylate cyclase (GGDEF)-like protein
MHNSTSSIFSSSPADEMDCFPTLYFINGSDSEQAIELRKGLVVAGRHQENDIVIMDKNASRRHFQIFKDGRFYYLSDSRSNNGTYLNGVRIHDETVLIDNDLITVGRTDLKFSHNLELCSKQHPKDIDKDKDKYKDKLTGCYKLSYLNTHLNDQFKQGGEAGKELSLIVFELDQCDELQKNAGESAVNSMLLKVIQRLSDHAVRDGDLLVRYSNKEFILLLHKLSIAEARDVANRLREKINGMTLYFDDYITKPTLSLGVTGCDSTITNATDLFTRADYALYEAKKRGGNSVAVYGATSSNKQVSSPA